MTTLDKHRPENLLYSNKVCDLSRITISEFPRRSADSLLKHDEKDCLHSNS